MLAHERVELADQLRVPTEREIGVDSILERRETLLLEPGRLALRKRLVREVSQRGPAPQRQRLPQPIPRELCITRPQRIAPLGHERLEPVHVELAVFSLEHIAAAPGYEHAITQGLTQVRDVHLHGLRRTRGRAFPPQLVDHAIGRDDLPAMQQQCRQHSPLLRTAEHQRPIRVDHLQRPKDSELKQLTAPRTTYHAPALCGKIVSCRAFTELQPS